MDLNNVRAGTYLLTAPLWEEYLSKPGQPFDCIRHRRGAVLDLNVDDARRLTAAGSVIAHDPANPTHALSADGSSIVAVLPPDPAVTGMVIPEEQLVVLADQLGIEPGATSEELVLAIQELQRAAAESAAAAEQAQAKADAGTVTAKGGQQLSAGDDTTPKSDGIADIVEWVGQDKDRANRALEAERTKAADKVRPRLVSALEEIITAPQGG